MHKRKEPYDKQRKKSDKNQRKKYSTRSDHLPITLEYELNIEDSKIIGSKITGKVLSYNTSYVSDLALIKPIGSEAYMLNQIKSYQNRRHYMDKAIALIHEKFPECDIVLTQEAIDADKITYQEGVHDKCAFSDSDNKFIGGFQGIIKKLADTNKVIEDITVTHNDKSYYNKGKFGDHFYLAYSVQKILGTETVYPTVLTIWKNDLGEFKEFYGKDLGIDDVYKEENTKHENIHRGRPFSCVRTNKGVTIINMHGPNGVKSNPPDINNKLKPTIIKYMEEAKVQFKSSWDTNLTILGGDLNDTNNELQNIDFNDGKLILMGKPDKTCCYEALGYTQGKYDKYGDIVLVANPLSKVTAVYPYSSKSGISDADSDSSESESSDDECNSGGRGRASYYTLNRKKKKRKKSIKKRHLVQYKTKTRKRKIKKTKTKKTKNN